MSFRFASSRELKSWSFKKGSKLWKFSYRVAWNYLTLNHSEFFMLSIKILLIKFRLLIKLVIFKTMKPENSLTKCECIHENKVCWQSLESGKESTCAEYTTDYGCFVVLFSPSVPILNDSIKSSWLSSNYTFNFCCYVAFSFISK